MSESERDNTPTDLVTPPDGYEHHGLDYEAPVIPIDRESSAGDGRRGGGPPEPPDDTPETKRRVRIRKLRVLGILFFLGTLAFVSSVFGMMMAVTSDLPELKKPSTRNSKLVDRNGRPLGLLTGNQQRFFINSNEIAPPMKQAIVAIEDRRFWTNEGIDLRGIGRALWQDVRAQSAVQGGSTITMQLVKIFLAAENERTVFNKLREAALAYEITRKWSKEEILRIYLNTIYFGNGAYGVESAARTYFGFSHPGCGESGQPRCAQMLAPHEAALIAGMVASPTMFDPLRNKVVAKQRRDLVLQRMLEQGYITRSQYDEGVLESLPTSRDVQPPIEDTTYPYFTSWVKQQVVDKFGGGQAGARRAFEGGLTIRTTLDSRLQEAAQDAVNAWLPSPDGPRASLVALDNRTGEVLAMVGGDDYAVRPFNLATQGQRQPGSAFKPFILAEALTQGISADSTWSSRQIDLCVAKTKKGRCKEYFNVNNYEDAYAGVQSLRTATTYSDNSVYAQVGREVGTQKVAQLARRLGIRTPVSKNLAMTLGGLREGVTPLDMAHAYQTLAQRGRFTYTTMSPGAVERSKLHPPVPGPAGIKEIDHRDDGKLKPVELPGGEKAVARAESWPVLKTSVADQVSSILGTVVTQGTAVAAQIPGTFVAGKTGTTENYGDAWFVGWTDKITVAVWVGYPDELRPMETEFRGQPVAGGTYPANIWRTFVERALQYEEYGTEEDEDEDPTLPPGTTAPTPAVPEDAAPTTPAVPDTSAPTGEGGTAPAPGTAPQPEPQQQAPAPEPADPAPTTPAPAEQPAAGGDSGGATAPPG
jgi:penicillin-binding protein 1A